MMVVLIALNIGGAELSIFSIALIIQVRLYYFFIANSKTISIACINSISISFEDGVISYDFNIIVIEV